MRRLALALIAVSLVRPALAEPIAAAAQPAPGLLCRTAIATAAKAHDVPLALMQAVGRVESGRRDPVSGTLRPWPWTIDADGQGSFYDSQPQAVAAVRRLQAEGTHSIDVGCMQVNLRHHPDAFASLEQAFDPAANADYAARLLQELFGQTGSWPQAAALYHSATPELAASYRQKVMQAWPEEARLEAASAPVTLARVAGNPLGQDLFPPPPRRTAGPRIIPRATPPGVPASPGRSLAAYRAMPIRPAWRRPGS